MMMHDHPSAGIVSFFSAGVVSFFSTGRRFLLRKGGGSEAEKTAIRQKQTSSRQGRLSWRPRYFDQRRCCRSLISDVTSKLLAFGEANMAGREHQLYRWRMTDYSRER